MKNTLKTVFVIVLGYTVLPVIVSGCASSHVDLTKNGTVSIESVASQKVEILWADVYQDGEDTIVYGGVRRNSFGMNPLKIHVDISIVSPEGEIWQKTRTRDIYVPKRRPGRGISWIRFREHFVSIPPNGSKVQLVCHSESHLSEDPGARCD